MKRIAAVVAGVSLIAWGARAEDTKSDTETRTESHHAKDGTGKTKKTMKHKHSGMHGTTSEKRTSEHAMKKDASGGTTETKEMKAEHDAPGSAHDAKMDSKETIERDAHGNVVKHEKTENGK